MINVLLFWLKTQKEMDMLIPYAREDEIHQQWEIMLILYGQKACIDFNSYVSISNL